MKDHCLSISLDKMGDKRPDPKWYWSPERQKDYDLVLLLAGKGTYRDEHSTWPVSRGSCMLFRPGGLYRGVQEDADPVAMLFIHFNFINAAGKPLILPESQLPPLHFKVERLEFVCSLAYNVIEAHRTQPAPGVRDAAHAWFGVLLLELARQTSQSHRTAAERAQAELVENVCATIRARISEPWRLQDVARQMNCSPEHAGRLFRKYKGVAPGEFILRTRIEAAQTLLVSSSQSVTQIAESLGYCDVYAFSRQFRQRIGVSPQKYR